MPVGGEGGGVVSFSRKARRVEKGRWEKRKELFLESLACMRWHVLKFNWILSINMWPMFTTVRRNKRARWTWETSSIHLKIDSHVKALYTLIRYTQQHTWPAFKIWCIVFTIFYTRTWDHTSWLSIVFFSDSQQLMKYSVFLPVI